MTDLVDGTGWSRAGKTAATELAEAARTAYLARSQESMREPSQCFNLLDVAPIAVEGMKVLVVDEFSRCFVSQNDRPWNWNFYLAPMWVAGIVIRYAILLPIRFLFMLSSTFFLLGVVFFGICPLIKNPERRLALQRKVIKLYSSSWVMSWTGVVRYHGIRPRRHANQVVVVNHTTVFDICLLLPNSDFAIIGQKQPGLMGIFEEKLLSVMGCIWFERKDANDRIYVAKKLKEHITDERNSPLLVFPEGTCVNNEYCIQFKKGAFELGAVVYPIAIKYNKIFSDPFWNSRTQSFMRHILNLWTSWAVVADVWYLEPQTIRPDESPAEFANRVKALIAHKAGLIDVQWDGYLKYLQPNESFVDEKQKLFADRLSEKLVLRAERSGSGDDAPSELRRREAGKRPE